MKIKVNFLVVALYLLAILFSCGLFRVLNIDTDESYFETNAEVKGKCSGEEAQAAQKRPATYAVSGTSYDTYLEAYFSNLTENFGFNYKGSCGYVAAGMLLSYFDNYYSNDIIPEGYDVKSEGTERNMNNRRNSPGVMNDEYLFDMYTDRDKKTANISAQEYYNYLREYEKYSFHAKLILFANQIQSLYNFKDKENPCEITMNDLIRVIHLYLYTERGYKWENDFWFEYPKSKDENTVKKFIIDQIDAGLPVLTMIGKHNSDGTKSYHFVIAYAHDDSGNIFVHSGWHSGFYSTMETIYNLGYDFYDNAFILNFYFSEHVHTDHYGVTIDGETNYYCYCSDEILTYQHLEHNYNKDHVSIGDASHIVFCVCGQFIYESHAFNDKYKSVNAQTHTSYCKCGASKENKHTWISYTPLLGGIGSYVQCKFCYHVKKLKDNEIVPIHKKYDKFV